MLIPVLKQLKSDKEDLEIHMIDLEDIWYVSVDDSKRVVYHTEHGEYYQPSNMEQVYAFLKLNDFQKLDRGVVVNLNNIKHFDNELGKVYFEEEVKKESKFATVSFTRIRKLKNMLKAKFSKDKT